MFRWLIGSEKNAKFSHFKVDLKKRSFSYLKAVQDAQGRRRRRRRRRRVTFASSFAFTSIPLEFRRMDWSASAGKRRKLFSRMRALFEMKYLPHFKAILTFEVSI